MNDWLDSALAHLDKMTAVDAANEAYDSTVIQKRRNTVLALVEARINGTPEEDVWKRKDTCTRRIYHQKWKVEPLFAETLAAVTSGARTAKAKTALENALYKLQVSTETAVDRAIELIQSRDEQVALRASFGLLDRADIKTAAKSSTSIEGEIPIAVVPPGLLEKLKP